MTDNSIDLLIKEVKSKEWADLFIWHKEAIFDKAKAMYRNEQEQLLFKYFKWHKLKGYEKHEVDHFAEFYEERKNTPED